MRRSMQLKHSVMIGFMGRQFDRFHEYQPARSLSANGWKWRAVCVELVSSRSTRKIFAPTSHKVSKSYGKLACLCRLSMST